MSMRFENNTGEVRTSWAGKFVASRKAPPLTDMAASAESHASRKFIDSFVTAASAIDGLIVDFASRPSCEIIEGMRGMPTSFLPN